MHSLGSVLSKASSQGAKGSNKMVYMFIALTSFVVAVVGAIIKSIWFSVPYGHESVAMRNGEVKYSKGKPVVKTSGWRCKVPVRDHQHEIDCRQKTTRLELQNIMAGDGKNEIRLTIGYHVLSWRDGEKFKYHPVKTLMFENVQERAEEICKDAVRFVLGSSETAASEWRSDELFDAMKPEVEKKLEDIGIGFDMAMLPDASQSEAQVQGKLIKDGLLGVVSSENRHEHLAAVPS